MYAPRNTNLSVLDRKYHGERGSKKAQGEGQKVRSADTIPDQNKSAQQCVLRKGEKRQEITRKTVESLFLPCQETQCVEVKGSRSENELRISCIPKLNCAPAGQEVQEGWFRRGQVNGRGGATMEHVVWEALFLMDHRDLDMTYPTFRTFWRPLRGIETSRHMHIRSQSRTMLTPMKTSE